MLNFAAVLWLTPFLSVNADQPNHHKLGVEALMKGDFDGAIKEFTAAIHQNPKDALSYFKRGLAHQEKRELDKAISDMSQSIEINSKDTTFRAGRGYVYQLKGDRTRAMEDYTKAVELGPGDYYARYLKGRLQLLQGEFAAAIKDLTEAIRLNKGKLPYPYLARGIAYRATGEHEKAYRDLKEAVQGDANLVDANISLAWILAASPVKGIRDGKIAITYAKKALDLTGGKGPRGAEATEALAAAYAEDGQFELAVTWQKKALEFKGRPKEIREEAEERLQLYQNKKPYRE